MTQSPIDTGWPGSTALVGSYDDIDGRHFLPITEREMGRASEAIVRVLDSFGFERGAAVIIVSLMDEAAQMVPLTEACVARGLIVLSVDASEFDAARLEAQQRRFRPVAVFGVGADLLRGAEALGFDPVALFGETAVWARPDAYDHLAALLPNVHRLVFLGPALGLECRARQGVHVDGREWTLAAPEGRITISSRLPRRTPFADLDTGVSGRTDARLCSCGNADPLVNPG